MAKPPARTQRSPEARAFRKLYKTARWYAIRGHQLRVEPLCRICLFRGIYTAATVVHHAEPHKGDEAKFHDSSKLVSLCAPCHDSAVQSEERRGYSKEIGENGLPVDQNHPCFRSAI